MRKHPPAVFSFLIQLKVDLYESCHTDMFLVHDEYKYGDLEICKIDCTIICLRGGLVNSSLQKIHAPKQFLAFHEITNHIYFRSIV